MRPAKTELTNMADRLAYLFGEQSCVTSGDSDVARVTHRVGREELRPRSPNEGTS